MEENRTKMAKTGKSVPGGPGVGERQAASTRDSKPKGTRSLASLTLFFTHLPRSIKRITSSLRSSHRTVKPSEPSKETSAQHESHTTDPANIEAVSQKHQAQNPSDQTSESESTATMAIPAADRPARSKESKENIPLERISSSVSRLSLKDNLLPGKHLAIKPPNPPGRTKEEKEAHEYFIHEALEMARLALRTNETPVGCVLVHKDAIIAKGMNATNVTRNGTRHAEFMAIAALLARTHPAKGKQDKDNTKRNLNNAYSVLEDMNEDDEEASRGYLYPYGQKLHPDAVVDRSIIKECVLYVTVEPCVMCASLLRQLGIKKVFFGAVNDKFGGTGGVFTIHKNNNPLGSELDSHHRGDGGSIEQGFEVEGGWARDEAVGLLRKFYVQENGRAPVPRKKEGRAARLAAQEQLALTVASTMQNSETESGTATDTDYPTSSMGDLDVPTSTEETERSV